MPPSALRELLAWLRRKKIRLVSLTELLHIATSPGPPGGPWVAFTLDDGYEDQVRLGLPIFREFDVPATLFPITGFVDGRLWLWWDQVDYLMSKTQQGSELIEDLKAEPSSARTEIILDLAGSLGVKLPTRAPAAFASASWDDLRRWEAAGLGCGCHTDSHPILATESAGVIEKEMALSWNRLRVELRAPQPILAFPNGRWGTDYGGREIRAAQQLGFRYGLSGEGGYLFSGPAGDLGEKATWQPFQLPRFYLGSDRPTMIRILSGLAPVPRRVVQFGSGPMTKGR